MTKSLILQATAAFLKTTGTGLRGFPSTKEAADCKRPPFATAPPRDNSNETLAALLWHVSGPGSEPLDPSRRPRTLNPKPFAELLQSLVHFHCPLCRPVAGLIGVYRAYLLLVVSIGFLGASWILASEVLISFKVCGARVCALASSSQDWGF